MSLRRHVLWVLLLLPVVLGDLLRPPRITPKNVHKSHITHHSLNTEEEERQHQAEHGWHPTEDTCAKALNVSKVRLASPTSLPSFTGISSTILTKFHGVQVALMFLTRGYVQHHDTWELWFRDVQGALPLSAMQVPSQLICWSYDKPTPLCTGKGTYCHDITFAKFPHEVSRLLPAAYAFTSVFEQQHLSGRTCHSKHACCVL